MKFLLAILFIAGNAHAESWDNKPLYDVLTSKAVQNVKITLKPFDTRGGLNTHFQGGKAVSTTQLGAPGCLVQVMGRNRDTFSSRPGDRYNGPIYKIDVDGAYTAKEPRLYSDRQEAGRYPEKSGISFHVAQEGGKVKELYVGCSRENGPLTLGDFKKAMGAYATVDVVGKEAAPAGGDANKPSGNASDAE